MVVSLALSDKSPVHRSKEYPEPEIRYEINLPDDDEDKEVPEKPKKTPKKNTDISVDEMLDNLLK